MDRRDSAERHKLPPEMAVEWGDGTPYLIQAPSPRLRRMVSYPGIDRLATGPGALSPRVWLLLETDMDKVHVVQLSVQEESLDAQLPRLTALLLMLDEQSIPLLKVTTYAQYLSGLDPEVPRPDVMPPVLPSQLLGRHGTEIAMPWHLGLTGGRLSDAQPGRTIGMRWQMFAGLKSSVRHFMETLDPDILALAELWRGGMTTARYNWVVGHQREKRAWRIQACRAMPGLIPMLAGEHGPLTERENALVKAVDEGEPLTEALVRAYGLRYPATARRILKRPATGKRYLPPTRFRTLTKALDQLPPDHVPEDSQAWMICETLLFNTLPDLTGLPPESAFNHALLRRLASGSWSEAAMRNNDLGLNDVEAPLLREFLGTYQDALCHALSNVLFSDPDDVGLLAASVLDEALVEQGWSQVRSSAQAWGRLRQQAQNEFPPLLRQLGEDFIWPSVLRERMDLGGSHIVPLCSKSDLDEEAEAMQNCLSKYVGPCLSGISHLFSIRAGPEGRCIANLDLAFRKTPEAGHEVIVVHCEGPANAKPGRLASRAALKLRDHLLGEEGQARIAETLEAFNKLNASRFQDEDDRVRANLALEMVLHALNHLPVEGLRLDRIVWRAISRLNAGAA